MYKYIKTKLTMISISLPSKMRYYDKYYVFIIKLQYIFIKHDNYIYD